MIKSTTATAAMEPSPAGGFALMSRAVAGTLASNISVFVFGLATSVILNRGLGPEGKGLYAALLTTAQLIALIASLGLAKSITYHLARAGEERGARFGTVASLAIGTLVVGAGIVFLLSSFGPTGRWGELLRVHRWPVILLVAGVLLNGYGLGALRGVRRFKETSLLQPATNLAFLVLLLAALACASLDLRSALAAKIGAAVAIVPLLVWRLRRHGFRFRPAFHRATARGLVGYGLGYFGYTVFQSLNYRFDVILVSSLTDAASTGYYSTATGLAEILWFLPNAIGAVLLPMVAGARGESGDALTARSCRLALPAMVCGVVGLLGGGRLIVSTLYGDAFLPAVEVLYAMGAGIVTNTLFTVLGTHLASRNRFRPLLLITFIGFAVNLGLNLWWIPRWGIVGAAWAGTVSYSVSGALTAIYFCRLTGIAPREFLLVRGEELARLGRKLRQRLRG